MKKGSFSCLFVLIMAGLHIQPLLINYQVTNKQVTERTCHKQTSCSKKKACSGEKKDCQNKGCNPFVPCSIGMCCYLVENFFTPSEIPAWNKQKLFLIDDNKLSKATSECWHPPEIVS
jgi:hypothetical protein